MPVTALDKKLFQLCHESPDDPKTNAKIAELLEQKANPNYQDAEGGGTPLMTQSYLIAVKKI